MTVSFVVAKGRIKLRKRFVGESSSGIEWERDLSSVTISVPVLRLDNA
jgi:hypothetical protein